MNSERLCVVGAGNIGRQIALVAALSGFETWSVDVDASHLGAAAVFTDEYLGARVEKNKLDQVAADAARARLNFTTDLGEAAALASFVIEAVTEKLDVKRGVFAQLDTICPPPCVLASNSSFIVSSLLAAVTEHGDRVCNLHFFSPVPVMKLAEVVQGPHTSERTVERALEMARALGKTPVLLQKECHGFIVNRIMLAAEREAFRILEEGVASPEQIDVAVEAGLNHPMGPFRLADFVGLDLFHEVLRETGQVPAVIEEMCDAGRLGRRSGVGFYRY